jgi:hypothetical protein
LLIGRQLAPKLPASNSRYLDLSGALKTAKNPYRLNGCITATIDFFYQYGYFKDQYSLEEIIKAFLRYSGNEIGKLHSYLSEFREDGSSNSFTGV